MLTFTPSTFVLGAAAALLAGVLASGCAVKHAVLQSPAHVDRWAIRLALGASLGCEAADNGISLYTFGKAEGIEERGGPKETYREANPLLKPFVRNPNLFTTMKIGQGLLASGLVIGLHDHDHPLIAHAIAWGNAAFKCWVASRNQQLLEAGRR